MSKHTTIKKKKDARRKKRLDNKNKRLQSNIERQYNSILFHIEEYEKNIVSDEFATKIIQELKNIRLNDRRLFTKKEELFYKAMKENGIEPIYKLMMQNVPKEKQTETHLNIITKIGNIVYNKLKEKGNLLKFIPFNDVNITPKGKSFIVIFEALLRHKTSWGTVHYSPFNPKISVNGKEYTVAFTKHAIERICERTVYDWKTYNGSGDCFAYLKKCIKFDYLCVDNGSNSQKFITFFEYCSPGYVSNIYADKIIENIKSEKSYCYRVGYCPIGLQDRFACAITLLTPGMKGTPEELLLKNYDLDRTNKIEIRNAIQDTITRKLLGETQNLKAAKWFHDNGIPQVLEINEKLFEE